MYFVTDINEVFRLLSESGSEPTYTDIAEDSDGVRIAVPCFTVGDDGRIS